MDLTCRYPRGEPLRVLIIGGCDVHKRIDLMRSLAEDFMMSAAGSENRLADKFSRANLPFHCYRLRRGCSPLADVLSLLALYLLIRRVRPDIVHAFATKPSVWGRLAARAANVPVVIGTVPGLGSLYSTERWTTRLLRAIYERLQKAACIVSDCTVFQNRADAREFVSRGVTSSQSSAVISGSGVRTDIFDASNVSRSAMRRLRLEIRADPEAVVVTMISRVIRSKGVIEFSEAARLLANAPKVRFVLVGPDDRESLDRLKAHELRSVSDSVTWLGPRQDVAEILATSDIFVLPTHYREGIPRVLLEAASMGLPLVTTAIPGCEEVVQNGKNGFLVVPGDVAGLARAIEALVQSVPMRRSFGERSRKLAVEQFDLSVVASTTAALYRHLTSQKCGGYQPTRRCPGTGRSALPPQPR